ncbi:chitooligosaccharidolytic beta-N-acetylglucosaminidase-like isoform X1 [Hydra vulgaris]|uniref:Beta-hexosaminidase n=2 Tax=Hydra vulgaris TaxID=6087 RepID=A0ABM4C4W6_HYDVU
MYICKFPSTLLLRFLQLAILTMIGVGVLLWVLLASSHAQQKCSRKNSVWTWVCQKNTCVKVDSEAFESTVELDTCKLTCGSSSMLFPKPSGKATFGNETVPFFPTKIFLNKIFCASKVCDPTTTFYINAAFNRFQNQIQETYTRLSKVPTIANDVNTCIDETKNRQFSVTINLKSKYERLTLETDESYSLTITSSSKQIDAVITAKTFYGARHGLETVSQLTAYLRSHNSMQVVNNVNIVDDKPAYKYRGLMLDTSRNYFSVDSILRLITAMSYNKMNTLHWHITDTHSFPIEIKSVPQLLQYGSYSPTRIYTHSDVRKIVDHAAVHGVRVLPEFDQPAHCGEGWEWGPKAGLGNLAVCVDKEPWQKYCVEPPCGQLNPTNNHLYNVLGKIYKEYFDLFNPDIFHAGGDEININCWNTTSEITDWLHKNYKGVGENEFMKMWGMFLQKSSQKIFEANANKELPLILWTSKMTSINYLNKYMDPKKHIVQIWTASTDNELQSIVESGFKTIFSTYDTLYLDCGYGNWLVEGNNWCSPYKDWKLLYGNDPVRILKSFNVTVTDKIKDSILGQESAMWSEQVDEYTSEGKIWPRTAALAERLWTNPSHDWRDAEYRLIFHRERLVERGIQADALQPLWCLQNAGHCYYDPNIQGEH